MMSRLFFAGPLPFDPELPLETWAQFTDTVSGWALLLLLAGTAVIVTLYAIHVRTLRIRRPQDLFQAFTPMRWLLLAPLPGLAAALLLSAEYGRRFPDSNVPATLLALRVGGLVAACTLCCAYLLCSLPMVTPARFRYRPIGPLLRGRRHSEDA
jgi:hypothetical protein